MKKYLMLIISQVLMMLLCFSMMSYGASLKVSSHPDDAQARINNPNSGGITPKILFLLSFAASLEEGDTISQAISNLEEIFKLYRSESGVSEEMESLVSKMVQLAKDDTVTISVIKNVKGKELKPHFHKSHAENLFIAKGAGQVLSDDRWVHIKSGSFHSSPVGKLHGIKNTTDEPLMVISISSPALEESDTHFME